MGSQEIGYLCTYLAIGAFAFVDFVLAFLPVTLIWKLQLDVKKKVGLAILLGCGIV